MDQNEPKKGQGKRILLILVCILALAGIAGVFAGGVFLGKYLVTQGNAQTADANDTGDRLNVILQEDEATSDAGNTTEEAHTEPTPSESPEPEEPAGEFSDIEAEIPENTEDDATEYVEDDGTLQVVILGDSIYDMVRDDTGLAYLVAEGLGANVYNLSVGGLSATIEQYESRSDADWNSTSGVGIAKILAGKVSVDVLRECTAKKIIAENMDQFKNTDLFIVEYGINDFLSERPTGYGSYNTDYFYFCNALEQIVDELRDAAPNANILLCEPHFCEFYGKDGAFLGSSNMVSNKYDTLAGYASNVDYIANTRGTYLWQAYLNSGINSYTTADYLIDGIHMTEEGRRRYADEMCGFIRRNILKTEQYVEEGAEENPQAD